VRIVVGFTPGGGPDIIARHLAQELGAVWKQQVIVENRPGAGGSVGAALVARAAPDGYTLFTPMDTTMVMNPLVMNNLPYDPLKDFSLISLLTKNMSLIVVRASDGPKSIKELIAKGRANPGKLNMGAGTITSRLGALLFAKEAGFDAQLVPFKGSAEISQALLSGTVDFALDSTGTALPLIRGGQYRVLAKYSTRPLPQLPDLPSVNDAAGLPDLAESSTWIGLTGPAGMPAAIIEKLTRKVASIYADPVMADRLEKAGITPVASSPAEFDAFIHSESERWAKVFKENSHLKLAD
jgi:tripartite-type tricarboxylate transporter receptor subunit TctC